MGEGYWAANKFCLSCTCHPSKLLLGHCAAYQREQNSRHLYKSVNGNAFQDPNNCVRVTLFETDFGFFHCFKRLFTSYIETNILTFTVPARADLLTLHGPLNLQTYNHIQNLSWHRGQLHNSWHYCTLCTYCHSRGY